MGRLQLSPRQGPHGNGHCLRLPARTCTRREEKRSGEQSVEWGVVQEMLQLPPPEPTLAPRAQL